MGYRSSDGEKCKRRADQLLSDTRSSAGELRLATILAGILRCGGQHGLCGATRPATKRKVLLGLRAPARLAASQQFAKGFERWAVRSEPTAVRHVASARAKFMRLTG